MSGTSERVLKVGVLGCGRIAQAAHLPAIAKADSVELVAVCDPSPTLAHGVAGRYGVSAFLEAGDLLATGVEAVVIAAPDRFHESLGIAALEAGKHVLMEKPLAADPSAGRRLADLARSRDLRLQTGAMKRYDPGFSRRYVEEIGDLISYNACTAFRRCDRRSKRRCFLTTWWWTRKCVPPRRPSSNRAAGPHTCWPRMAPTSSTWCATSPASPSGFGYRAHGLEMTTPGTARWDSPVVVSGHWR